MPESKIIAVVGATGAQEGGLVRAILNDADSGFAVRAITRNASSDKAMQLSELGAEVVEADVDDTESLRAAFAGAYGAHCVTFYWEHFAPETEHRHAVNMAEAARQAGLEHVIWSTLEDTRKLVPLTDDRMPTLMGEYKVPHFDAKGAANHVFTDAGVPTTFLLTSFYWDNLIHFGMGPKKGPDGTLVFALPMGDNRLPGIASEDIGACALGIFKGGSEYIGRTVGIAGEHLTGEQMAAELSTAFGQDVHYTDVPPDVYRGLDFPGAEDLGNMFQYKRDFEEQFCGARSLDEARAISPGLRTFAAWLAPNRDQIPIG